MRKDLLSIVLLAMLMAGNPLVGQPVGLVSATPTETSDWRPNWLEVGTFAEYRAGCIREACDWPVKPVFADGSRWQDDIVAVPLSLSWTIRNLTNGKALVGITLSYSIQRVLYENFEAVGYEHIEEVSQNTTATVVLSSRDIIDIDGNPTGKWIVWINPGLEKTNETETAVVDWIEGTSVLWKIYTPITNEFLGIRTEMGTFHTWIPASTYIYYPEIEAWEERFRLNREFYAYGRFWNGTGPEGSLFLRPAFHVATGILLRTPTFVDDVLTQDFGIIGGVSEMALYDTNAPLFSANQAFDPSLWFSYGVLLLGGSWLLVAAVLAWQSFSGSSAQSRTLRRGTALRETLPRERK
ncbi:MAG: hypothetical protein ACE5IJ_04875 [Thermoplasmata archaeon]